MNVDFDIQFHPFLLDPSLPEDKWVNVIRNRVIFTLKSLLIRNLGRPVDKKERYQLKFGKERFEGMEKMMIQRGKLVGINLSVPAVVFLQSRLLNA